MQAPAHFVHGDYTLVSGPQRLLDLARPPSRNDTLRPFLPEGESLIPPQLVEGALGEGGRFSIVNVWRNNRPRARRHAPHGLLRRPERHARRPRRLRDPLQRPHRRELFLEARSRTPLVLLSEVTPDEAILIKQWDSAGTLARTQGSEGDPAGGGPCTFSFHSAFKDPATPPDAPDRWSLEVRCAVLYA